MHPPPVLQLVRHPPLSLFPLLLHQLLRLNPPLLNKCLPMLLRHSRSSKPSISAHQVPAFWGAIPNVRIKWILFLPPFFIHTCRAFSQSDNQPASSPPQIHSSLQGLLTIPLLQPFLLHLPLIPSPQRPPLRRGVESTRIRCRRARRAAVLPPHLQCRPLDYFPPWCSGPPPTYAAPIGRRLTGPCGATALRPLDPPCQGSTS